MRAIGIGILVFLGMTAVWGLWIYKVFKPVNEKEIKEIVNRYFGLVFKTSLLIALATTLIIW